jgi:hypothetical protein
MGAAANSLNAATQSENVSMVELVLLACLIKQPDHCETFRIPIAAEMQTPQCVWQSQMHVAQWSGNHPDWVVKKISCEMPEA